MAEEDGRMAVESYEIFEATLNNNAQDLKTALRQLQRHLSPPPVLPTRPCASPHPFRRHPRRPHHHHDHLHARQSAEVLNGRKQRCAGRGSHGSPSRGRRGQARGLQDCSYHVVSQVISTTKARVGAHRAFQLLRASNAMETAVYHKSHSKSRPLSMELDDLPDTADDHETTPLHLAAALGMQSVLRLLLLQESAHDSLGLRDSLGHTPLTAAVVSQEVSVVRLVLRKTLSLSRHLHHVLDDLLEDAVRVAVVQGRTEAVAELLREGRARRRVSSGMPHLLCLAVARGDLPSLQLLLRCGAATVRDEVEEPENPLCLAVYRFRNNTPEELEMVKCLLQYGADPNDQGYIDSAPLLYGSALHFAVTNYADPVDGHLVGPSPDIVQALLDHKADPNARNACGESPLFLVRPGPCDRTLRLLLQYGADPRLGSYRRDVYHTSNTFLSSACEEEHVVHFAQVLLEHDPGLLSVRDGLGWTIMHRAVERPRLFQFLLRRGADPHALDNVGNSVIDHLLMSQSTAQGLRQKCFSLLACVKVGVSFRRPENGQKTLLRFFHPLGSRSSESVCLGKSVQLVMMLILLEVGYLLPNDHVQCCTCSLTSEWPELVKDVVKILTRRPSSLLSGCRRAVHSAMDHPTGHREEAIARLSLLPDVLKRYLQFSDLDTLVRDTLGCVEEREMSQPDSAGRLN